jgi:photosystem II stability/assembly factor-like uncharacterized protein
MRARVLIPLLLTCVFAQAQAPKPSDPYLKDLRWRNIGPFRGGRAVAVAGVTSQPETYYFGATGGGIFKTTDGGMNWTPVTDGQIGTGSVGALAVAESDPNTIYAGMGEACIRGNASHGDGVYKSTDGGRTWKHMGLAETQHIGRVIVHPRNADVVYVAALGHQFGPNDQRGVFRSTDGGKTWKQILTRGPKAGAVDLSMDPNNPNVIYAGFWEVYRKPWSLESGGPGSGLWKSTDGGDNWTDLSRNDGMPKGILGRVGVSVSGANSDRVWAIVEAEEGGVFRSDNGGRTWTRTNSDRNLRQRAWYYTHVEADPKNVDRVYVQNTSLYRSNDGGRTFTAIPTPHGDNHDIWINPRDPERMIDANDGGANISTNGGRTWSPQNNQPTSQFYRVTVDNEFPYNVYGAQQDNSTVRTASRAPGGITEREWWDVGGGESGWIAPDPRNPDVVYAGSYGGLITRYDRKTGIQRNINPWPDNPMGYGADALKYRFQWNFPILISPHDPKVMYAAANVLFRSTNEGQSWEAISGDLTRNDRTKQGSSGGPITKDNTSVEYYCTIFTLAESLKAKGVLWAGSDDGLVHLSRDNGKTWTNVTPPRDIMPEFIQINVIDASPHDPAVAYVAATMYKHDDYRPFLYKTSDYGKTWKKIVNGIPENAFTRVIREDPNKRGLLIAGTETGIYSSFDDGETWRSMQMNLPVVSITDAAFQARDKELVVATQGRAFWIFDDLPLLYQMSEATRSADMHLYQPKETIRMQGGGGRISGPVGQNPPGGVVVYYSFQAKPQGEVTLEFLDPAGKPIRKYSSNEAPATADAPQGRRFGGGGSTRVAANAGLNRFVWDMRYPDAAGFPGLIMWAASTRGPLAIPGTYKVKLTAGGKTLEQPFTIVKDPRAPTTPEDFNKQISLGLQIRDKLSQANLAVVQIRDVRAQVDGLAARYSDNKAIVDSAKALNKKLTSVEEELYQTKNRSSQDPLNYPIKLNNKIGALAGVVESTDVAPTAQSYMVFEDLASQLNAQLKSLDGILKGDLPAFNKLVRDQNVPAVVVKEAKAAGPSQE